MDFRLKNGEQVRTVMALKAPSTVIEAGDIVALDSNGLIIKALAASTAIAWAPNGAGDGETEIEVTIGNDFTLIGTGSANFAATHKGAEVDLSYSSNDLRINLGASSTDVFKVGISKDAGTVGSASDIEVRINKPIF